MEEVVKIQRDFEIDSKYTRLKYTIQDVVWSSLLNDRFDGTAKSFKFTTDRYG